MLTTEIQQISERFENASPFEILSWASETFGDELAIVTSFQVTGIVSLHMMQSIAPRMPVLTLDTGLLFPETQDLIDQLEARFNLDLRRIRPRQTTAQQARDYGDRLWERNPDRCCHIRKTIPLRDALVDFAAWITGLRRDQSPQRAATPVISRDTRNRSIKIAPFANWTEDAVWQYIHEHNLPYNQLHDMAYPSIGCWTCTSATSADEDRRGGRWSKRGKTECGIHIPLPSISASDVRV